VAGSGRSRADEALLAALASGATVERAAQRAQVSERTAYRRLANRDFLARVDRARGEMVARAVGHLAAGAASAAVALRKLLKSGSDGVKLQAAKALLELGSRLRESTELERRLADLEARLATEGKKGRA
jgi:hypothetical protein